MGIDWNGIRSKKAMTDRTAEDIAQDQRLDALEARAAKAEARLIEVSNKLEELEPIVRLLEGLSKL